MASVGAMLMGCRDAGARRAAPQEARDAPIELSIPVDVETFDPRFVADYISIRASRMVHAGLVRLDPDSLEPRPYLAKGWRWIDDRTLHVDLREDVRFHSGAPFTAHDVAASIAAYLSPMVASRHLRVVEAIDRVEEVGEHAVRVHLGRAHATLVTDLEIPILRGDQAMGRPDFRGEMDGLGPYQVSRATRGDVLLTPAEGGAMPRPAHAVVLRTVHDDNARALRLIAGRSDVAMNVLTLLPALEGRAGLSVVTRPGANLTYVVARLDRGVLADVRVRRAVSLGIDRAMLARTLFEGHVQVASTLIPPSHWAHTDLEQPGYDPGASRKLLAEAGAGRPRFTLLTSTDRFRGTVARAMAQELAEAGFAIDVVALELGTLLARLGAGDFELAVLGFPELTEPNVLRNLFHSEFVPPVGYNRARVHDAELDAWLDEGDRSNDVAARRGIYAKVERRIREQAYMLPLWNEDQVVVVSARARGFVPSAEGRWLSMAGVP